jgi:hypothetical protein
LNEIQQLEIVIDDAFEFVLRTKEKYDLIVIDVFQDTKMPNFLYENYFINRICLLKSKGFVLFNTMLLNEEHNLRNKNIFQISARLITPLKRSRVEIHNELIVIEKESKLNCCTPFFSFITATYISYFRWNSKIKFDEKSFVNCF